MAARSRSAPSPIEQQSVQGQLFSRVRRLLGERFDASCAIDTLDRATGGEFYLCGGTIRRALLGDRLSGDLDIIIPNGDTRAVEALDRLRVPFLLNSQQHRRYRWNTLQIDIFQPREFFSGFTDVEDVLGFFDLRINAVSFHMGTSRIIDPFDVLGQTRLTDPGINWPRWEAMPPLQLVVLAIRLAKILHETPLLALPALDADRLNADVIPHVHACNWDDVHQRFPQGKDEFLHVFQRLIAHE